MRHPFAIALAAAAAFSIGTAVAHADPDEWHPERARNPYSTAQPSPPAYPPAYSYQQPDYTWRSYGENPAQFQARVESLMNQRVEHIERRVSAGELPVQALYDARQDRENVERHIRFAARDGVISRHEEREIFSMARGIGAPDHGYGPGYGYGGGPRVPDHDRWSPMNY